MDNSLKQYLITAGQQTGLFLNQDKMQRQEQDEWQHQAGLLTVPLYFTLRPVKEYLQHYRGSWTQLGIGARPVGELGDDEQGVGLVFETRFSLAYMEGDSPIDPSLVIDEILARLKDFAGSYPTEAAWLFVDPLHWEMDLEGEIIYELEESNDPWLDFGMYPTLGVNVWVYEAPSEAAFEQSLADLNDDSPLGRAIHEAMQRLALLFRWLDIEAPSIPPLLDLLGED